MDKATELVIVQQIGREIAELLKIKEQVKSWSESGDLSFERAHWIAGKIGETINDLNAVLGLYSSVNSNV